MFVVLLVLAVGAAIGCAVSNAIGKPVDRLPLTPPRVLRLLQGREPKPACPHIAQSWTQNTLG